MIETIADIQRLAVEGFTDWASLGDVKVIQKDDLLLFNYTDKAQYAGRWNVLERVSRGLIINRVTGEIVARPFDKFFNWGERGQATDAPIVYVAKKIDGSMGATYRDTDGVLRVATRGSFTSEQALWATEWLHNTYDEFLAEWPDDSTYLFEIIYPENRVVIDYGSYSGLVLLAARNKETGEYWNQSALKAFSEDWGIDRPINYVGFTTDGLLSSCAILPANEEGYVATFADGQMFKFKGKAYCELHKLISGISFKSALEAVASGMVDDFRARVPDEFLGEWNGYIAEIEETAAGIKLLADTVYEQAPKDSRKDYAAYVTRVAPQIASYAFLKLDGKPLEPVIYKSAFKDREKIGLGKQGVYTEDTYKDKKE